MKEKYFQDTATLYIELHAVEVSETRDLDIHGEVCGITIEHAGERGYQRFV